MTSLLLPRKSAPAGSSDWMALLYTILSKSGIGGNFLNLIKNILKIPTDNIILNNENQIYLHKDSNEARTSGLTTFI